MDEHDILILMSEDIKKVWINVSDISMTCDGVIIDHVIDTLYDLAILTPPKAKWRLSSLEFQKVQTVINCII
jgi:hypothetical protein